MAFRSESDSIGIKQIPAEAYYGVQSLRGAENFHITGTKLHPEFINSLAAIKKASALPLITKTADASKMLSEHAFSDFQKDLYCSHLYQAVYQAKTGQALPNEYTHSVIIR